MNPSQTSEIPPSGGRAQKQGSDLLHVGGSLPEKKLYIDRAADRQLLEVLRDHGFCHVLGPRQIGKSSLRRRTVMRLREQGVRCVSIDLTECCSPDINEWYAGIMHMMREQLELRPDARAVRKTLPPALRWHDFLQHEVMATIEGPLVIFMDELDVIRQMEFGQEFLGALRSVYEERGRVACFRRLSLCLFGVFAPRDLCVNPTITPFNVAVQLRLGDFTRAEFDAFLPAIGSLRGDGKAWLDAVYGWTGGHPFMSQKLLRHLTTTSIASSLPEDVATAGQVEELFFKDPFSDSNVDAARTRFMRQDDRVSQEQKLGLYESILLQGAVLVPKIDDVSLELLLCGLVRLETDVDGLCLRVRNQIFASIFDKKWIRDQGTQRRLGEAVRRWLESGRDPDHVLTGAMLSEAEAWAENRRDLTPEEEAFLRAGVELRGKLEAQESALEATRQRALRQSTELLALRDRKRLERIRTAAWIGLVLIAAFWVYTAQKLENAAEERAELAQEAERAAKESLAREKTLKQKAINATNRAVEAQEKEEAARKLTEQALRQVDGAREKAERAAHRALEAERKARELAKKEQDARELAVAQRKRAEDAQAEADRQREEANRQKENADRLREKAVAQKDSKARDERALLAGLGTIVPAINPMFKKYRNQKAGTPIETALEAFSSKSTQADQIPPAAIASLVFTLIDEAPFRRSPYVRSATTIWFAPSGRQVFVYDSSGGSWLWAVEATSPPIPVRSVGIVSASYSSDSRSIAVAASNGTVSLIRASDGVVVGTWKGPPGRRTMVEFTADDRFLLVTGEAASADVLEADDLRPVWKLEHGSRIGVAATQVFRASSDPRTVSGASSPSRTSRLLFATGDDAGHVKVWESQCADEDPTRLPRAGLDADGRPSLRLVSEMRLEIPITSLSFSSASPPHLLIGNREGRTHLWEVDSGRALLEPLRHPGPVTSLKLYGKGEYIATTTTTRRRGPSITLWSASPEEQKEDSLSAPDYPLKAEPIVTLPTSPNALNALFRGVFDFYLTLDREHLHELLRNESMMFSPGGGQIVIDPRHGPTRHYPASVEALFNIACVAVQLDSERPYRLPGSCPRVSIALPSPPQAAR